MNLLIALTINAITALALAYFVWPGFAFVGALTMAAILITAISGRPDKAFWL